MPALTNDLLSQTAGDLMSQNVIVLAEDMPLHEAARRLMENRVAGAPVVDANGMCSGVLSSADFLRLAAAKAGSPASSSQSDPPSCAFQMPRHDAARSLFVQCTLPFGMCAAQARQTKPDGGVDIACNHPECVFAEWQIVETKTLGTYVVKDLMTSDPVTVAIDESIRVVARKMIDAHIHRVIVVDHAGRPAGIVSSTDILAAVSFAEDTQK